ncbi:MULTISPECIES: DUF4340 domain-containing protein [Cycloclasticus]|jgi:hypothetical protein|nr:MULTISPECIES: DUF4340 domain-containing protein [Cycloclasticus]ATI02627.1 DUF4340 domain-containing protein [Cycloclasticus sp. PY97N]MBV1899086.1 DUF4340 domain-containing protein [Cycloclasticus sp.]
MKNRLLINLLLITLVVCLGMIAWLKPGHEAPKKTNLAGLDINTIQHIKIERTAANTIELKRLQNQWYLTQPVNTLALAGKVERLLKISQIKPTTSYPLEKQPLSQFGLDTPTVKVSFNKKTLNIGKTESVQSRRYVSNDTQLFLLDDTFLHHLTAPVDAYIDTRLIPNNGQIIGLKTPEITLQRQEDNTWKSIQSPTDELSSDAVQMLLDEWRFARAITVTTKFDATPTEQIIISLYEQPNLIFHLIKQKDSVLLVSNDKKLAYQFSDTKYKKMTTLPRLETPDA